MKQGVFEVLMYLFENYMDDDNPTHSNPEEIKTALSDAGFQKTHIAKAFDWLEGLVSLQTEEKQLPNHSRQALRIFNEKERKKLTVDCQGFLIFLEQMGVLDANSREHVIDRLMALESDEIDLNQLKWVVLMVLFNQPNVDEAYAWMENMVLENISKDFH